MATWDLHLRVGGHLWANVLLLGYHMSWGYVLCVVHIGLRCGSNLWGGDMGWHWRSVTGSWHHMWRLLWHIPLWRGIALGWEAILLRRKWLLILCGHTWLWGHVPMGVCLKGMGGGVCLRLGELFWLLVLLLWHCRNLSRGMYG